MTRITLPIYALLLSLALTAVPLCSSLQPEKVKPQLGRRALLSAAVAVATTTTTTTGDKANARLFQPQFQYLDKDLLPYPDFKNKLDNNEIKQVQFGSDGRSLIALDSKGIQYQLKDIPDDPPLLKELYQKKITVTLQAYPFQKQMNAVSWFRETLGIADDLTDEERYEYRGYKTYRQNIPERSYVPANLITGYDLSRNMNPGGKKK